MENIFRGKKVGIWGLGVVGKSVLSFISRFDCSISVLEQRAITEEERLLLENHNALLVEQAFLPQFLEMNDLIIPSPGVNLTLHKDFKDKWLVELTIFAQYIKKPVIAITGSAGKTTVTTLITQLLNLSGIKAVAAGNIGTPMLDILSVQENYDVIVLELSSFQLHYQTLFQPDIALVTNIYPNHLDHHKDMQEYIEAKGKIFKYQREDQTAFIPLEWMEAFWPYIGKQKIVWISLEDNEDIIASLSDITCKNNWQLILSVLEKFNISPEQVLSCKSKLSLPEHRMEYLGKHKGVRFYNDSKSTIMESTLNAVEQCTTKPFLLLGGLSKGINRAPLLKKLKDKVKHIVCFGKESDLLQEMCKKNGIECSSYSSLEEAFKGTLEKLVPHDIVLFSPSGSSFDLFKNYEERGKTFKKLFNSLTP